MTVFAIDVNVKDLQNLKKCLSNVYPDAHIILHSEVDTAEIFNAIAQIKPDCIMIEAELGNCDGISLAKQLKQRFSSAYICITNDSGDFATQAWDIHANGYLIKPITENKIRRYL